MCAALARNVHVVSFYFKGSDCFFWLVVAIQTVPVCAVGENNLPVEFLKKKKQIFTVEDVGRSHQPWPAVSA